MVDGQHIKELMDDGVMKNPPKSPKPPEMPDEPPKATNKPMGTQEDEDDDGPLPGEVVGAPA